jgi:hypothetical protein
MSTKVGQNKQKPIGNSRRGLKPPKSPLHILARVMALLENPLKVVIMRKGGLPLTQEKPGFRFY